MVLTVLNWDVADVLGHLNSPKHDSRCVDCRSSEGDIAVLETADPSVPEHVEHVAAQQEVERAVDEVLRLDWKR